MIPTLLYGIFLYIIVRVTSMKHTVSLKEYTEQIYILGVEKKILKKLSLKVKDKIFQSKNNYVNRIQKTNEQTKNLFKQIKEPILTSVPP